MTPVTATSAFHQIGAVAGLLAMVCLAAHGLMYARHARAVGRLRKWAGSRPEAALARRRAIEATTGASRGARPSWRRRALAIGAVAATGAAAAVAIVVVSTIHTGGRAAARPAAKAIDDLADVPRRTRARVTVAVLNGTSAPGAARRLATSLAALGFRKGTIGDAAAPIRGTRVAYQDRDAVPFARLIARRLHLRGAPIQLDAQTRKLSGPNAEVVVTLGTA